MKKRIKLQGIIVFTVLIMSIIFSKLVFPQWKKEPLDEFLDAIGIGLILFGFLFRIIARGYKEDKSSHGRILVKNGPYYLVRHPMYFGTLLIGTGIVMSLFKLWVFLFFLTVYFLIYIPQIKKEEDVLLKYFGKEYKIYCLNTQKYLPRFYQLLNIKDYPRLKWSWIKKELSSLVTVIITIVAIETWQDVKLFGLEEFFKELLEFLVVILVFVLIIILAQGKNSEAVKHNT